MTGSTAARVYLDHNAGAPARPEAIEAARAVMAAGGNPSSVHREGRAARRTVEAARAAVGRLAGVRPGQVVFTSGATEANVLALSPDLLRAGRPFRAGRLLVSAVEHPSVLRGGRFPAGSIVTIPVDGAGRVDCAALDRLLADGVGPDAPAMVAVQLANSETGVIQPLAEVSRIVRARGAILVCDAVQGAGRLPLDALDVDFLTLSAHKIGGIQGAGALVAVACDLWPAPLLPGGGQEANRRGGTEAVPALAAFGVAAEASRLELEKISRIRDLRDWLEMALRTISEDVTVFADGADRLANTLSVALPGIPAETAVIAFDLEGFAISAGSACSSGKVSASHVLQAMGVSGDLVRGGLRISLGWNTTRADVERFVEAWRLVTARLRLRTGRVDREWEGQGIRPVRIS